MDEPGEAQLFGWLRSRGLSEEEANALIERIDQEGQAEVEIEGV
jgi:Fe-S cluster assembly scaffold protein SufB